MTQEAEADWSTRLAQSIAGEVRRYRQARGLSAQQLADRCASLGMPIQRSVLANLESGRRTTVTVAEVLVLAKALGVPPGALIFPVGTQPVVEILPDGYVEPLSAVNWLSGHVFFDDNVAESFYDSPLGLLRRHDDEAKGLLRLLTARSHARSGLVDAQRNYEPHRERHTELSERSAFLLARINDISARLKRHPEYDKFDQYVVEHRQIVDEASEMSALGAQVTYASQRVNQLEQEVAAKTDVVQALRRHMRAVGVLPPALPKQLSHIDPSPEARDLGDLVEKEREPAEPPIQNILSAEAKQAAKPEVTAVPTAGESDTRSRTAGSAEELGVLLSELRPRLEKLEEELRIIQRENRERMGE